jgi:Spy/CpxP family protein refolding chaperone
MGYELAMQFQRIVAMIACAVAICFVSACSKEAQAEPPQRSADDLLSGMRLKSVTKDLELTEEQQGKVQTLFDEEAKEIAKVNADTTLSTTQRLNRIAELKKETYSNIKPLLTAAQTEKFDQLMSKSERRRKRS